MPQQRGSLMYYRRMLNVSATVALWGCIVLGVGSLGGAYAAFASLETLADAAERDAMLGYVWFAMLMFAVSAVLGLVCWMLREGRLGRMDYAGSRGLRWRFGVREYAPRVISLT